MKTALWMLAAVWLLLPGPEPAAPADPLEELVTAIQAVEPGDREGARQAAEQLLDWTETECMASEEALRAILDARGVPAADTACSFAAVLAEADTLAEDQTAYTRAVRSLAPLFTDVLETDSTPYRREDSRWPGSLADLQGVWYDGEMQELLVISGDTCRVVIPWLGHYGETAYAARLRDRSASGYCPSLEIDFRGSGDFSGPLAYYVSGADSSHFWSNTQSQRFDRLG